MVLLFSSVRSHADLSCATIFNPDENVPKFASLRKYSVAPALDNRHV